MYQNEALCGNGSKSGLYDKLSHSLPQELQQMQKRSNAQVSELQALAEEQFSRANRLSDDLAKIKSKKVGVMKVCSFDANL